MTDEFDNWAGSFHYNAARLHRPETVEQIQEIVTGATKVKALGSRHSFNDVADCAGDLIAMDRLNQIVSIDRERMTVTVEAGIRYAALGDALNAQGLAIHNLASLPHISVAGACATATHGSGDGNGNLATAVAGLEIVTASGDILRVSREDDQRTGIPLQNKLVVNLGALGIVTKVTLDVLPTFEVRQDLYENLSLGQLEANFDAITSSAYSVSLFTDWAGPRFNQVWRKSRIGSPADAARVAEPEFFGATRATRNLHPIAGISAENCTEQMGDPGPWQDRLPHFRSQFTPSSGEELQTEYLVPRHNALAALRAVDALRDRIQPLLQISEIRTIAADDLWMSPCYNQACVGIHFTWVKDWAAVSQLLPVIEAALAPFNARPHWGKMFTMDAAQIQPLYKKLPEFRSLAEKSDPEGKFRNGFLDRYIFGGA